MHAAIPAGECAADLFDAFPTHSEIGGPYGSCMLNELFWKVFEELASPQKDDILTDWITDKETSLDINVIRNSNHSKKDREAIWEEIKVYVMSVFESEKRRVDYKFEEDMRRPFSVKLPLIKRWRPQMSRYGGDTG